MSDEDRSAELEQAILEKRIKLRPKPVVVENHSLTCWWCDEPVTVKKRWCSPDCRNGWERENG